MSEPDTRMETPARPPGARDLLVQRLVDRHGLDQDAAYAAVARAQLGTTGGPHEQLVRDEAQVVLAEVHSAVAARAAAALRSITESLRSLGEAARAAIASTQGDFELSPRPDQRSPAEPPPRAAGRRDRPAWQTPYGPPTHHH